RTTGGGVESLRRPFQVSQYCPRYWRDGPTTQPRPACPGARAGPPAPLLGVGATDQATPSHFAGLPPQLAAVGSTFTCLVRASPIGRSRVCTGIDFCAALRRRQHRQLSAFTPLLNRRGGDDFVARTIYLAGATGFASPTRSRRAAGDHHYSAACRS